MFTALSTVRYNKDVSNLISSRWGDRSSYVSGCQCVNACYSVSLSCGWATESMSMSDFGDRCQRLRLQYVKSVCCHGRFYQTVIRLIRKLHKVLYTVLHDILTYFFWFYNTTFTTCLLNLKLNHLFILYFYKKIYQKINTIEIVFNWLNRLILISGTYAWGSVVVTDCAKKTIKLWY